jgi:hypothetical protein
MMQLDKKLQKVETLIETGYRVEIMRYVEEAFEIFKQAPGLFILFASIHLGITVLCRLLFPYAGGLVALLITSPMQIGYYEAARKIRREEELSFGDFFTPYYRFGGILGLHLCIMIFVIIGLVLLVIPGIYLAVGFTLAPCFFWFLPRPQLGGVNNIIESIEISRRLVTKEWFSFFAFGLIIGLMVLVGLLLLGVGLLVAVPVGYIAVYLCYEDLVGTEDEMEDEVNAEITGM